ncbi:FecR domain-containing protein, partial [Aquimarina sp. RZ0]|uniref:FecR domain-containing protein n=1 Tax=Aquimarina sp. RZ0 TaxID=2607730 RepID=UPI0011F2D0B8
MRINKVIGILFIIIFWNSKICAQEKSIAAYQDTSLDKVLNSLEDIYNVKFSFNTKIIKGKSIKIAGALALQEILQKIQAQTTLFFEKINNRY